MSSSSSDASSNDALSADIDADNEDAILQEDGSCADIDDNEDVPQEDRRCDAAGGGKTKRRFYTSCALA